MAARRTRAADDHVCPAVETWLLTYSDMVTALLIFFIVMFAMGQIDIAKFEQFKMGIARSGATPIDDGLLENGEGPFEQAIVRPEIINAPDDRDGPGGNGNRPMSSTVEDARTFERVEAEITHALAALDADPQVSFQVQERGLVITVLSDRVLFAPGSADLGAGGVALVDALAGTLAPLPNRLTIEGHTDSRPISTPRFPSNWELSVGRSSTVLRALVERHGLRPERLNAAGYADQRPVGPNDTPDGRAANRRVELVVHRLAPGEGVGIVNEGGA